MRAGGMMDDPVRSHGHHHHQRPAAAQPLHIQRLEASLDMRPFMNYAKNILVRPLTSSDESESDHGDESMRAERKRIHGVSTSKSDRRADKQSMYNFSQVGPDRKWLQDILLSDTDTDDEISDEDEYVRNMLKDHVREQKYRAKYYQNGNNAQYGYYGTGMLSTHDSFNEHQRSIVGVKRPRKYKKHDKPPKPTKVKKISKKQQKLLAKQQKQLEREERAAALEASGGDGGDWDQEVGEAEGPFEDQSPGGSKKVRKKAIMLKTPEMMAARRRKLWQLMAKKELGKLQRARMNNHKEALTGCKRVATVCMKIGRQRAMQSQKMMRETVWRAKRLTREMQGYWKKYDRFERDNRRRMEKEAEEQRKQDVELVEAKRQQRKLNFLITQTELYAHFMSKKLGKGSEEEQLRILSQLDEEANHPRLAAIDDYSSERMKQTAKKNASDAFHSERARTQQFDHLTNLPPPESLLPPSGPPTDGYIDDVPQPNLFKGSLKGYQIKGMTWLANLYDKGISGILADEMGLGKTVQSIAFLCHIAETYGVWGPFLIISPASTLHNWQQEMQRFVPDFNVVPYWGSPNERKILRQFWDTKDLHTKDSSFHVVITSYQLVVSDYKYFNRIKWQYMILDEAQAIKSSSSVRWKLLLGFNCRNRLLLSGTPIQNSMAELWALLHFIMPTLFDSHDEFNEWFSKDIESHAENKTGIDEKQISRLHMILKPFMLRRIKKDVENELSDKIEIMVYCPLTTRQKLLYISLKRKIRIEDLLQYADRGGGGGGSSGDGVGGTGADKNVTSSLMNLVMQFRKVCNHPELFERRDAKSPFHVRVEEYRIPRLVFDEGVLARAMPSRAHLLYNRFSIFKAENVHRSMFPRHESDATIHYRSFIDLNDSTFSFSRFCNVEVIDIERLVHGGLIYFFKSCQAQLKPMRRLAYQKMWHKNEKMVPHPTRLSTMLLEPSAEQNLHFQHSVVMHSMLFTSTIATPSAFYEFAPVTVCPMPESMEHRLIRSRAVERAQMQMEIKEEPDLDAAMPAEMLCPAVVKTSPGKKDAIVALLPEHHHVRRPSRVWPCQPTSLPAFLYGFGPKVAGNGRQQYISSRSAQWANIRHEQCENEEGYELVERGIRLCRPMLGWSNIIVPDKQTLISDAGKLAVLDSLLTRLKTQNHRVLIFSLMTKVIDLLEEYMWHKKHRYMRLDGSSKISARRDMVADFQNRSEIFVFLLSTRAGGLGINLTAADTVIFYDSDWNPTVDDQAMDRAHRLGQTKQVTVYRLICKGTIEERILQRAREKSEIQRMVISGGNFKPDTLKPKEVVSLLLDDEEIELKYRQRNEERKSVCADEQPSVMASTSVAAVAAAASRVDRDGRDRKRKVAASAAASTHAVAKHSTVDATKRSRYDDGLSTAATSSGLSMEDLFSVDAVGPAPASPLPSDTSQSSVAIKLEPDVLAMDESSNEALVVDYDSPVATAESAGNDFSYHALDKPTRRRHPPRGTKRGRPRGSRRGGGSGSTGRSAGHLAVTTTNVDPRLSPASIGSTSVDAGTPVTMSPASSSSNTLVPSPFRQSLTPRRGPGRPRLKPNGPANQAHRTMVRPRRPFGPLVVSVKSSTTTALPPPNTRKPVISPAAPVADRSNSTTAETPPDDADDHVDVEESPI